MSKKKNDSDKGYKVTSRKTGKSVTVKAKDVKSAKKAAKRAVKKIPKKKRVLAGIICLFVIAAAIYIFDVAVMPLEYVKFAFVKQNAARGEKEMKIHFLDIGQGDSIIIEFPDGKNMIIDGGDTAAKIYSHIITYTKNLGIKYFDYMMLTHSDADHVGGLDDVLNYFEVRKIFMPAIDEDVWVTKAYDKFLQAAKSETYTADDGTTKKAEVVSTYTGDFIASSNDSEDFMFAVLSPGQDLYDKLNAGLKKGNATAKQKNDISPVVLIEYLQVRTLLTGDANAAVEDNVIDFYQSGGYNLDTDGKGSMFSLGGGNFNIVLEDIDLFKAGHHGSRDSSGDKLLSVIKPKYTVISVGAGNDYLHPHKETLDRLSAVGCVVYRTDLGGDITATVAPSADEKGSLSFKFSDTSNYKDLSIRVRIHMIYRRERAA